MNLDEARLRAHTEAMRTNARYCEVMRQVREDRLERERLAALPRPNSRFRVLVHHFGLTRTVLCWTDRRTGSWRWHKALRAEIELDVDDVREFRERCLEELRPGVYAEWSDSRERWAS